MKTKPYSPRPEYDSTCDYYDTLSKTEAYGYVAARYRDGEANQTTMCVITFCDGSSLTLEVTTGHANKDRNKGEIVEKIVDVLEEHLKSDGDFGWRSDIPM